MEIVREGIKKMVCFNEQFKESMYNYLLWGDNGSGIIFNTFSGAIIHITQSDWVNKCFSEKDKEVLMENGFIVPLGKDECSVVVKSIKGSEICNPDYFTIIPTTNCNARCFYCYESCYDKETMTDETISGLSEYITENIKGPFVLDLYGGEPLLCVDKINKLISCIGQNFDLSKHDWHTVITTNAILFDEALVEHVSDKWNLKIAHITIDGCEEEHNIRKNVKGVNAFIKSKNSILMLLKKGVYVNLRIHLDKNNYLSLNKVFENIREFFDYKNFRVFPTYLFPPENNMCSYFQDSEKEELFLYVFKTMIEMGLIDSLVPLLPVPKKMACSAMNPAQVVIAPNGTIHRCVQEFSGNNSGRDEKFTCGEIHEMCINCKDLPICLGGCRHNYEKKNITPCMRTHYIVRPLLKLILDQFDCK